MATPQQAHALSSHYKKKWAEMYKSEAVLNRHSARWGFDAMLMDMSPADARGLIDYYFETSSVNRHSLDFFLYNYERLIEGKRVKDEDAARLKSIRAETKRRTEEWRKKRGVNRTESN